jgi:FkbM family methyltransferase
MSTPVFSAQRFPTTPFEPLHKILPLECELKVVDVGANPIEGPAPYLPLLNAGHTEVVGFEPNLAALERLNQVKGPKETYLPYAVADGGRHTLRLCYASGMSSLLEPNLAVIGLFDRYPAWAEILQEIEVDTVRLDDMPETAGLDLLKIDIQGGELMVFQNAVERLSHAVVVHTEVLFVEMYVGQPVFSDLDIFLRAQGFRIHRMEPVVSCDLKPLQFGPPQAPHSQLVFADAIYVRDLTRLDLMSVDQLLKLAVILHDCYLSYDCVLHLLVEHDKRTGKDFSLTYFKLIVQAT